MKQGVIMRNVLPLMLAGGACMLLGLGASFPVMAQNGGMRPVAALKILVEARELNARCGFVPEARDELADYAAKAEVAAAEREGIEAVRKALDEGRKEAKAQACSAESKDFVLAALDAAREAMRQARALYGMPRDKGEQTAQEGASVPNREQHAASAASKRNKAEDAAAAATEQRGQVAAVMPRLRPGRAGDDLPALERKRERAHRHGPKMLRPARRDMAGNRKPAASRLQKRTVAAKATARKESSARAGAVKALERRYVALAGTYYLDLRCKRLPYPVALSLYKRVKALHYRLLKEGGPQAILRAKAAAKARAAMRTCRTLKVAER